VWWYWWWLQLAHIKYKLSVISLFSNFTWAEWYVKFEYMQPNFRLLWCITHFQVSSYQSCIVHFCSLLTKWHHTMYKLTMNLSRRETTWRRVILYTKASLTTSRSATHLSAILHHCVFKQWIILYLLFPPSSFPPCNFQSFQLSTGLIYIICDMTYSTI